MTSIIECYSISKYLLTQGGIMEQTNRKRLNKEQRKKQIIEAATLVFTEKGYVATTTASIAKEADISEVTLFRYFNSKQDIFDAVIAPIMKHQTRGIPQNGVLLKKETLLKNMLLDRIAFLEANQGVIKLILNESHVNQGDKYVVKMVNALTELMQQVNIHLDNPFAIRILMGSFLSFLYFPEKDKERLTKYVDDIVEVLIQ